MTSTITAVGGAPDPGRVAKCNALLLAPTVNITDLPETISFTLISKIASDSKDQ